LIKILKLELSGLLDGLMENNYLIDIAHKNRRGEEIGIFSLDALHPMVVQAYLLSALEDGFPAVIEVNAQAFSDNRTTPNAFVNNVNQIACTINFPVKQLIFSIYDLNLVLQNNQKNATLFISELVKTGFGIFGLNVSMANIGELVRAIENSACGNGGMNEPLYVIDLTGVQSDPDGNYFIDPGKIGANIRQLIEGVMVDCGEQIMERILAVRLDIGRGHDGETVFPFSKAVFEDVLNQSNDHFPNLLGAEHIDHQPRSVLNALIKAHFAYMRVGSEFTYVMREAIFSLAMMENETLQGKPGVYLSNLMVELDKAMQFSPDQWSAYYQGNGFEQLLSRKYSLHDRSRFFWGEADVQEAWARLFQNLVSYPIPLTVLRQFMPDQYEHVIYGEIENTPEALVLDKLRGNIKRYATACGWRGDE
jgi:D-tagatose-1,6-bisphosphate aldolase subunit GatZ/KbaZ